MRFRVALFVLFLSVGLAGVGRADAPPVQDIFISSGTPGPFALSWNNILEGTEKVTVNAVPQLRNLDYTLDAAAGTVTFTHPLPTSAAVEITYPLDPLHSQHSGGGRTIPLSVDLMRNEHGYFSLDALGRQQADTPSNLTLGVGLGWNGGQSAHLTSRFLYTPTGASAADSTSGSQASGRTGLSLAGTAGAGHWGTFSLGLTRAGLGLDSSGDSSFQAGRQLLTLGAALTPVKTVSAQLSFSRSDPMTGDSAVAQTNSSLALTVTPGAQTTLKASVTQADSGNDSATQNVGLSLNSQATRTLAVSAAFDDQNLPGTASDSQTIQLKTVLTPSKIYSLETTAGQSRLGEATTAQQGITLSLTPHSAMQIQAGFLLRQKSSDSAPETLQTSEAILGGTIHPFSCLELSGSYKSRAASAADTDPGDLFDTSTARIAFAPLKTVKLTGTYDQNPDDGWNLSSNADSLQRLARRGLGLETHFGALGLSGGYDWSRAYGTPDVEEGIHAGLGLRFSAATQISVGYQTQQNMLDPAAPLATAYTVGFTHTLGDRFSLSVTGKRQQTASTVSPDYNASANLGMKF